MSSIQPTASEEGHLYFVIFQFSDFSCDYLRFFDENKDIFGEYNIAYQLLDGEYAGTRWQDHLWSALFAIKTHNEDGSYTETIVDSKKYIKSVLCQLDELDKKCRDLLFCLPTSHIAAIPTLLEYLHDKKRFPYLHKSTPRLLWLLTGRDKEVEGVYRWNYPQVSVEGLFSNVKKYKDRWCKACRDVMELLGSDNVCILREDGPKHTSVEKIFSALRWPVLTNICKPLGDTRVYSRELFTFLKRVVQRLNLPYVAVAHALRDMEANPTYMCDTQPFLSPRRLREVYEAYHQPLQDLVERYAFEIESLNPQLWPQNPWWPYDGLQEARYMELLQLLFTQHPKLALTCLPCIQLCTPAERACIDQTLSSPCITVSSTVPKLNVLTLTKNHAPFLADCIESVLAQQTHFPVHHIIVDDVSSDGTQAILYDYAAKYDSITPLFMPPDRPSGENVRALFRACHSPFVALCDGDDYFTDPYKLQKQVDFLKNNQTCGMCFHPVKIVYEDGTERSRIYPQRELLPRGQRPLYYLADLLKCNFIQTSSVVYRWRFSEDLPGWFEGDLVPGDWYWHLLHAEVGKIGFLEDVMSVYRRHRKALFYTAETESSSIGHRLQYGMAELRFYDVTNRHFGRRYERAILCFTNNVLADFMQYYLQTGDNCLLKKVEELYPNFFAHFLSELKIMKGRSPNMVPHSATQS